MLTKLIYALILCCFILTTNSLAKPVTFIPQTNKSETKVNNTSLQLHSVAEIPENIVIGGASNLAISADGQIGFFSAVKGNFVYAYDLNTGQKLSQFQTGKKAANLSLFDNGQKRLLAVINLSDPANNEPITISLLDVSNAKKISLLSAFILPPDLTVNLTVLKPIFDFNGDRVFIASKNPSSLFVFETSTGRMLDELPLTSGINSLSVSYQDNSLLLAAISVDEKKVTIFESLSNSKLQQKTSFSLPENSGLIANNNFCFSKNATVGYIASAKSNKLFSFDITTGAMIESYDVGDVPAQIALTNIGSKVRIAVVNTGKNHGFLANSVSIIESDNSGYFKNITVFLPMLGANLVTDSTIKFNDKGDVGFVGTRNQSLFIFDSQTGEQLAETKLLGSATKFAFSNNRLVVLTSDTASKRLVVLNTKTSKPESEKLKLMVGSDNSPKVELSPETTIKLTPSLIKINQVKAYRVGRILKIRLVGRGFEPSSQILINNRPVNTSYLRANRLVARFPIKFLSGKCDFDVIVKHSDKVNSSIFRKDLKCK